MLIALFLIVAVFLLYVTAVMCFILLPSFSPTIIQTILPNDAVFVKIPQSHWLTHVSIELQGPFITGCHANVISIKCEHAIKNTNISMRSGNELDYLYIEKEGMITFTLNSSEHLTNPYYAWIFISIQSAMSNASNDFKNLACGKPPEDVWCVDLSETEGFVLPNSNYYFIRCNNRDYDCTLVDIDINSSKYNFDSTKHFQIDSILINVHETEQKIRLRSNFNPGHIDDSICLLMKLSHQCSTANPSIY